MRLLEREAQLRDLHAALELARQGRGTTVLLSGEAGIGKTWLLRAFAAQAAKARVLVGTCEDLLTPRPLGPFRDMARDAGGALAGLGDDRDAFIDALLEAMAFPRCPAVLIVEDAHWADDASLDVIRYLARRIEWLAAMLVVSYRDEELDSAHPFRRLVGALAGPTVLRLELEGLSALRGTARRPRSPASPWSGADGWTAWRSPGCTASPPRRCTRSTASARPPGTPTRRWRSGRRPARRRWSWARRC
jgi:predicted ATPase